MCEKIAVDFQYLAQNRMSVANCNTPVAIGPSVPSIFFFLMTEGIRFLGTDLRAT